MNRNQTHRYSLKIFYRIIRVKTTNILKISVLNFYIRVAFGRFAKLTSQNQAFQVSGIRLHSCACKLVFKTKNPGSRLKNLAGKKNQPAHELASPDLPILATSETQNSPWKKNKELPMRKINPQNSFTIIENSV